MRNEVTEMHDLEFPIFACSHCRDVVAAVSKAGGLGVLGAVAHTPEALEVDLAWIEDEIGDKPYGVDLIIPAKYAGDEDGGYTTDDLIKLIPAEHRAFVDDIAHGTKVSKRAHGIGIAGPQVRQGRRGQALPVFGFDFVG